MNFNFSISKVSFGILTIVVLFIAMVWVINLPAFDEDLDPFIIESLKPVQMPPNEENAYYAFWGLPASSDKSFLDAGHRMIARYRDNRDIKSLDQLTGKDYREIWGGKNLDSGWTDSFESCAARRTYGCNSKLAIHLKNSPITNQRLTLMLQRYEQVTSMSQFQNIGDHTFASPLPPYGTLMKLRQLNLAKAYNSENVAYFIKQIEKDIRFWKLLLEQGSTLIDKMVAIASIWSDVQALSEFLRIDNNLSLQDHQLIANILTPLTAQQLNIGGAFAFEQKAFHHMISNFETEGNFQSGSWFFQPNSTINTYHQYFTAPLINMSKLSVREFYNRIKPDGIGQSDCCFKEFETLVSSSPASLYNIGGKILLSTSVIGAQDYIARVHDLNGVISLVGLQVQLKEVSEETIGDWISRSNITNPYTGEPMIYDQKNNWLGFECLNEGSFCKIRL